MRAGRSILRLQHRIAADLLVLLQDTIDTARSISNEMRPASLDMLGLHATLRQAVERFGERHGLETLACLRAEKPRLPVIILTMYTEAQYARRALQAGANAYLSKDVSHEELLRAIRQVAIGVQMCVSVKTIGTHRHRILDKLGASSNAELVQYAIRHGLLD